MQTSTFQEGNQLVEQEFRKFYEKHDYGMAIALYMKMPSRTDIDAFDVFDCYTAQRSHRLFFEEDSVIDLKYLLCIPKKPNDDLTCFSFAMYRHVREPGFQLEGWSVITLVKPTLYETECYSVQSDLGTLHSGKTSSRVDRYVEIIKHHSKSDGNPACKFSFRERQEDQLFLEFQEDQLYILDLDDTD
jgi:hypothetical protein